MNIDRRSLRPKTHAIFPTPHVSHSHYRLPLMNYHLVYDQGRPSERMGDNVQECSTTQRPSEGLLAVSINY